MRQILALVAAAALCCSVGFGIARADSMTFGMTANEAIQQARERVAAGDLDGAIKGLSQFVSAHPEQLAAERLLGDLCYRRGDLHRAQTLYRDILTYSPNDKETHNRLGSVYATEGHLDAAIDEFNRSLPGADSVPDLVRLHRLRGDLAEYERQREHDALAMSGDAEAQLELGEVYEATNRPDLAIRFLDRALADDAGSFAAMNYLGLAYMDEGNYPAATTEFTTCLAKDSFNYACANNLGSAYIETAQYPQAAKELAFAHNLQPEGGEALVNLGYLADMRGDWKTAVSYYVQSMTVYPYAPEAYVDLGDTYNAHGLYQLAEAALAKGLAVAPYDGRLHYLLGEAYSHQGDGAQAESQYKAAEMSDDPAVKTMAQERVAALQARPGSLPRP